MMSEGIFTWDCCEIEFLRDFLGFKAGDKVIGEYAGANFHHLHVPTETGWKCAHLRAELGEWADGNARRTARPLLPHEMPNHLYGYYVPGPFYHGHHLYLDGKWIQSNYHWFQSGSNRILTAIGKTSSEFRHWQDVCAYVMKLYPDGVYLRDLEQSTTEAQP